MLRTQSVVIVLLGMSCGLVFLGYDIRIGVRIRAFDLGLVVVSAIFCWYALRRGLRTDTAPLLLALATYGLCVSCNAMLQTSTGTAIRESAQLFLFALFLLAFVQYVSNPQATHRFLIVFLVTLWVLALWNAFYHVSRGSTAGWKSLGDQKLTHSVIFLIMTLMLFSPLRPRGKWWWWPLVALALLFLVLSGERKGWVAAIPGIVTAMLISDEGGIDGRAMRRVFVAIAVFVGLAMVMIALAPFSPYVEKQVVSIVDFVQLLFSSDQTRAAADTTLSNQGRLFGIEFAIQQFLAHPLFGLGPTNYVQVLDAMNIDDVFQKGAHNEILRIAAELGLTGLISYALIYLAIIWRVIVLARRMNQLDPYAQFRMRLGLGLATYGFIANVFLAGGGLNTYFVMLPAALLFSTPPRAAPAYISAPAAHHARAWSGSARFSRTRLSA